jgi:aerobic-type carbon monoxide dehydrogenase small subunit (CoxS/CutS family)
MIATQALSMNINGKDVGPLEVPVGLMMIDFLHEYVNLTGSRLGCGQGVCHACVAILDHPDGTSETIRTCITGAHFFQGKRVRTVEGHGKRNDKGEVVEMTPCSRLSSSTSASSAATARRVRQRCDRAGGKAQA